MDKKKYTKGYMNQILKTLGLATFVFTSVRSLPAATVTFSDELSGATIYHTDVDSDGIDDLVFSTEDPAGFNTIRPGLNQIYIKEPGLEGTSTLNPDLRIDFLHGATNTLAFGFALNSSSAQYFYGASLQLYDTQGNNIGFASIPGVFTRTSDGISSFPENQLILAFSGTAAYGLIDFTSSFGRYLLDNVEGTFASSESPSPIPEPASSMLTMLSLASVVFVGKTKR